MREIVKLAVVAAVILIAAVLIALFASGYISAFKPGGAKEKAGEHVVGGSGGIGKGVSAVSTPAPSPSMPPMPPAPESMPAAAMQQPFPQGQPVAMAQPVQPSAESCLLQRPILPPEQPPMPSSLPQGPSWPDQSGSGGSWFDSRVIHDRNEMPPMAGPSASPAPPAYEPQPANKLERQAFSWSPGEMGWMQIILRIIGMMPFLFPGLSPGHTWWSSTS